MDLFIFNSKSYKQRVDQRISANAKRKSFAPAPSLLIRDRLFAPSSTPQTEQKTQNPSSGEATAQPTLFDTSRFPAWLTGPMAGVGYMSGMMGDLKQSFSSELQNRFVAMKQRSVELESTVTH